MHVRSLPHATHDTFCLNFPKGGTAACPLLALQIQQETADTVTMPNESHRGINMLPQKQRQRLRIIHLGWLAMVVAVACSVLVSREREALSFAWLGLAALPGLAGYLLLGA
jgi:hypothetical protein